MEVALLFSSIALFLLYLILKPFTGKNYRLPPSPAAALPILGHLHLLTPPLHRTFHRFSETHGPIFSLKLGARRVVVVSSPALAEECFTKNDVVLSNRPQVLVDKYIGYNHTTVAGAPYGHHRRSLRRLAAAAALSSARLNALSEVRQDEMRRTLLDLTNGKDFTAVKLRPKLFDLVFNMLMRMLAGERYSSGEGQFGKKVHEMVREVFECAQSSNPEDFLPFLEWIDYRGLRKKMGDLGKNLDGFYERLLAEHRRERRNTIIGHLLSLQESEPQFYTDTTIKGFITV